MIVFSIVIISRFSHAGFQGGRGGGAICGGRSCIGSGVPGKQGRGGVGFHPGHDKDLQQGAMSSRLVSCLLMGLPMVLHPVIFLRLLLHRLLSSMHHLTKWKSCASRSSWASQPEPWRARASSCDTDTPTLGRRRKVNLTLDFAETKSEEGATTPIEQPFPKTKKAPKLESKGSKEKDEEAKNGKSITNVFQRASKSRQNSFNSPLTTGPSKSSSYQKNDTPTASSERGWKLRETIAAFSSKDVSDTISHFLPSVLRSSDSHQSISTSSRSPSPPVISPPTQRRKSSRFKNSVLSKSAAETTTSSESTPNMVSTENEKDLDSCEQYINAFQKQLQNLPSYERVDCIPGNNLRPRSRSVPRVTYTSMSTLNIPVTRSPSLTPEIARNSEFVLSHGNLSAAYSTTHLTAPHTMAASTPLMSPGHNMKLPLRTPLSLTGGIPTSLGKCTSGSPYLSPHTSPRSVTSPRLLSPALSPITPPRHEDLMSSASSTVTPNPYRRLDSPVYIVVDMPAVHRAVLTCVEVCSKIACF